MNIENLPDEARTIIKEMLLTGFYLGKQSKHNILRFCSPEKGLISLHYGTGDKVSTEGYGVSGWWVVMDNPGFNWKSSFCSTPEGALEEYLAWWRDQ